MEVNYICPLDLLAEVAATHFKSEIIRTSGNQVAATVDQAVVNANQVAATADQAVIIDMVSRAEPLPEFQVIPQPPEFQPMLQLPPQFQPMSPPQFQPMSSPQLQPPPLPQSTLQLPPQPTPPDQTKALGHNSEKLSLEQIRKLPEKSLIDMFSEFISDELNRKYTFVCCLVPSECSNAFHSFGNEARAKSRLKFHLLAHIRELTAASGKREPFMAEPVNVRKKKLQEMTRKSTRKKITSKQQSNKLKRDHLEPSPKKCKSGKAIKIDAQNIEKTVQDSSPIWSSITEYGYDAFVEEIDNTFIETQSQYLPYFSYDLSAENYDQAVRNMQSYVSDIKSSVPVGRCKRKKSRSYNRAVSKRKRNSKVQSSSTKELKFVHRENNSQMTCDEQSELCMRIYHDHTYTSMNDKIFNESSDGVYRDPCNPKKTSYRCQIKESPQIIPTPPFPYVYVPILPHAARILEVASKTKTAGCKCKNNDITERHDIHVVNQKPASYSSAEGSDPRRAENQSTSGNILNFGTDVNASLNVCMKGASLEDGSNNEANDIKPPQIMNDASPDCPETLQAVEKNLALKCIRALRTKKKDERGPLTCQICKNKSFTAQATLMYHYRSHAGIKPYSCSVCKATFTRQHSLNYHMLIHNNKSRFVCTDCGRNFRHPSHYKEHLKRHTGETPDKRRD